MVCPGASAIAGHGVCDVRLPDAGALAHAAREGRVAEAIPIPRDTHCRRNRTTRALAVGLPPAVLGPERNRHFRTQRQLPGGQPGRTSERRPANGAQRPTPGARCPDLGRNGVVPLCVVARGLPAGGSERFRALRLRRLPSRTAQSVSLGRACSSPRDTWTPPRRAMDVGARSVWRRPCGRSRTNPTDIAGAGRILRVDRRLGCGFVRAALRRIRAAKGGRSPPSSRLRGARGRPRHCSLFGSGRRTVVSETCASP